jgi:tetratricopeptide (TPR) repeat protein
MSELRQEPDDHKALRLMRLGKLPEALACARRAVAGKRRCVPAHGLLALILLSLGRRAEAEEAVVNALQYEPGSADAYDALAHVSMLLGQHHRSNALYKRVVEISPTTPGFWYNLASSERSFGRLQEAETACERAIALGSIEYPSYLLRSELRVQTEDHNHIEELESRLRQPDVDDRARVFLGYALGKELDDLQRFDDAFTQFSTAAAVRRRRLSYDVAGDEMKLKRIREAFDTVQPAASAREGSGQYIFIVGLPRSGTTLLERILTGLPGVTSNGETANFERALIAAAAGGSGDVFARAAVADPDIVARDFAALARTGDTAGAIIDKLPMNYLYLAAIRRALPDARLILVRRSPIDSCFAMFRTLFGEAYPFSYSFEDLARYYAAYDALISHFKNLLGEGLHEVRYEDLVSDAPRVGRAVAQHCGIEWRDTALDVQNNPGVSLTASAAQIRRPIYASSAGRWRKYHRHLMPLIRRLHDAGVALPPDALAGG